MNLMIKTVNFLIMYLQRGVTLKKKAQNQKLKISLK
jgi:hypothetical protein